MEDNNMENQQEEQQEDQHDDTVTLSDVMAERDSLREELATVKAQAAALQNELAETKKVNFTLARQIEVKEEDPNKFFKEVLNV